MRMGERKRDRDTKKIEVIMRGTEREGGDSKRVKTQN